MKRLRQLAAIMFTDIQGYTALMQHDEEKAIQYRSKHRNLFNSTTKKYKGRILQYYGDGTLSIFHSAIDAVKCAIEMQLGFQKAPAIPVRIGLHTGDIILSEDEIIGDSVNVAARMESLAVPGSVFISDKVYDEIKNQTSIKTSKLKSYKLKNIDKPIQVYAISNEGLIVPKLEDLEGEAGSDFTPTNLKQKKSLVKPNVRQPSDVGPLFEDISPQEELEHTDNNTTDEHTKIGKTISHYKIIGKLGEGGMGKIYLAIDTKLKRKIALKFLPEHFTADKEATERFEREAQAAAALNHPNIITIHEISEFEGQTFIAMEYVQGTSLRERIKDSPLQIDDTINILTQVCGGLEKAHKMGIVHRDIKPENILMDVNGRVKVVDFGLAKLKGVSRLTKETSTLGTIHYMSPEQASGGIVDHRSDIWSLGVVLYEMLAGQLPFKGEYAQSVIYSILNEKPAEIGQLRPDIPNDLEKIVEKCLAKDSNERYQEVNDLIIEIQNLGKQGKDDVLLQTENRKRKTRKLSSILFATIPIFVILITIMTLIGYFKFGRDKATEKSELLSIAVLPFINFRSDPEIDFLSYALADQIIGGLTYLKNISVRPSSSIRKYEEKKVDIQTIGKDLKVGYVLTGNYLKEAQDIRLNVELVEVKNDDILWREPIQVQYENVFKLQDIVSEKVINGLKIQFSQEERKRMQKDIPQNSLAYEYYLRGISYPLSIQDNLLAIEMLKKSIQIDSLFAPTWDALGLRSHLLALHEMRPADEYIKVEQLYLKALSQNNELLSALCNLALLYTDIGRIEKGVELARGALDINPNNALAHFALSYIYRYAGMLNESEQEVEIALAIDPNDIRFYSAGATYLYLGKYKKAYEVFDLCDECAVAIAKKGEILYREGQIDQAQEYANRLLQMEPDGLLGLLIDGFKALVEQNMDKGLQFAQQIERGNPNDAEALYTLASMYALLGDKAGCVRVLAKAIDGGFFNYPFMLKDSFLDSVRDSAEFRQVLLTAQEKHEAFKQKYMIKK